MKRAVQQTTRDLRRHNRSVLLSRLYLQGPTSRQDLTQMSGLSSATVSNVVADLINDGVVGEAGSVDSDGGRPRTLIQVRSEYGHVVGVDIGETHIEIGLFDYTLVTLATATYPVAGTRLDPGAVARLVVAGVNEVAGKAGVGLDALLGVGVGVPGAVQAGGGELVHAPTLGWSAVPLGDMLRRDIPVPVLLDNCARTLGQAEMWRGAGRGAGRVVVALLGVGVGAAVATASESFRDIGGTTSTASEWGHTVVTVDGRRCRCGSNGCLEAYVGAEAVLADYLALPDAMPFRHEGAEARLEELVARAEVPGSAAARALDRAARYLGIGIANLINLLSPDRVVLSGWAGATMGPAILGDVRETVRAHALPYMYGNVRIELGELGPEAAALGAATLPVVQVLAAGGVPGVG
ncbi:ROK family transcriptional regulator [Sphaerisporangium album]|uniref:ROK family transcriptional regulator n=1 Tax=Sphaerisporangium album TaxID=509200 RepID=A0A367EXG4_9ACTN|nr:ROK family transcriptional regulator [Sphaerisporangium album]RCG22814.1 ROK family transcriptional regulator [Sphaerisporangium album]